ncbi:hypothetical protein COCMIDRAFT_91979 [Bipolaris oryzae ATCC 44560]|uniref:Uncharacterized protein n=1 Tax=Bipolaris oryzae ATCC 44560 TaxID=930090 RepID=W6ZAG3_COCMI|nr:uncharacterized protein COCMIDRAFT_91979 [Bipolaris oryzae ATCC 44560]EUC46783.1 hypothetical protein COCMIDRAFT_91979 [Bipolaris oryzae ATCC 44560]
MAAPTNPQLPSLAIPNPNSTTYEADLTAVVSYARSHPASVTAMDTVNTAASMKTCGVYSKIANRFTTPAYMTGMTCSNTDEKEHMEYFYNWYCGFCVVFHGLGCQGDIRWSGGPKFPPNDRHPVHGAQSYFCY